MPIFVLNITRNRAGAISQCSPGSLTNWGTTDTEVCSAAEAAAGNGTGQNSSVPTGGVLSPAGGTCTANASDVEWGYSCNVGDYGQINRTSTITYTYTADSVGGCTDPTANQGKHVKMVVV